MIFLKILLILLVILILLLLLILIPKIWLTLILRLTSDTKTGLLKIQLAGKVLGGQVTIEWPKISARVSICGLNLTVWQRGAEPPIVKKPAKPKSAEKPKVRPAKHSTAEWIGFGKILLERFFKIPKIERFHANLVVGLGNPAATGLLMGAYYTLRQIPAVFQSVQIAPDFINKKITGEIEFCGSIRLIKTIPLLILTLRFLWHKK